MRTRTSLLQISLCLACGGIGTVLIICLFIGFSIHSPVGKYALHTAFFLQAFSLGVNALTDRSLYKRYTPHNPSPQMKRFRLISELLWWSAMALRLASLTLLLFGLECTDPWVRYLCIPGYLLGPVGWLGLLLASYRRRQATVCAQDIRTSESKLSGVL
ncbi:MAG: hypothetical protein IKM59_03405 [Oscillospiraceae bacterium]|nr:hypothetical protein [Oscillospiraceae bacterium]